MAAAAHAFGSFSIREYASKMRSIDVEKSWPFGREKELSRDEINGLLPPIACRKYRWWLDELARGKPEVGEDSRVEFPKPDTQRVETAGLEEVSGLGFENLRIEEAEADLGTGKAVLGLDEEPTVKICPVCEKFSASTVNAVNAHIDGCLVQASRAERREMREKKAKSRMQKKRSIVELFAIAPQISAVDENNRDGDGGSEIDAAAAEAAKKKKMRRKKKLKELMEKMKKSKKKNKMEGRSKKKHSSGILSFLTRLDAKKENIHKLKIPSEVDYAQILQCSLRNKRLRKDIINPIGIRKGKPTNMKSLLKKSQQKKFQASKSIARLQVEPPLFPIHSILKNRSRATSLQKNSAISNLQGANLVEQKQGRHSDRHVRFSGKDEFIGHTKTGNPSNKLPQVKNICEVFSDAMTAPSSEDQLVEVDKNIPAMDEAQEVTESDIDVSISIMDGSEVQSVQHDRCLADTHSHDAPCPVIFSRNRVFHDMGSVSLDMDLNQPLVHHDSLHLFNTNSSSLSHKLAGIPKSPNFVSKEREVGIQAEADVQRTTATSRCLGDSFAYPIPSSGMNSLANITRSGISQPSLSCSILNMGMNEKQPYLSSGVSPNSNGCPLHYQQLRCISQKDPTNSIRSSMVERKKHLPYKSGNLRESRSIMDPIFLRSGRCADEDFIGLPLNSQGELISLHPSGKVGLKQVFKKQNMTMGSVGNFPIYNVVGGVMDHSNKKDRPQSVISIPSLKLFPEQNYLKNPMSEPTSSALGLSVVKNASRTRIQYDTDRENELSFHQLDPELHLMDSSYHGCTSSNQCHNHSEKKNDQSIENSDGAFQPITQPTLRLMGKDVMVGKSNKDDQDLEDGKVWTDKEVVTVQHPPDNCVQRCFPQERTACPLYGMFGKVDHLVESQSCPTSPNIFQMKPVEPSSASGYNCQTHLMSRNGLPLINGNHCSELPPVTHSLLNKASKFQKSCFSGTGLVKMSHQIPMQASSSHNYCLQHMLLNSIQSKQNPGLTLRETSDFNMSFSSRDSERHGQPSCMQCSLLDSPQLLNAVQQKETLYSYPSQPFNSFPNYHPCFMTGTNLLPLPSPYFTSMISSPSQRSNTSKLCLQNPSSPASMAPPLIPSVPMLKPISAIKSGFRTRNKVMDSGRSKSAVSKDHDLSKKAKKRSADREDMSYGITKKPHLEMLDSNAGMGSKEVQELQRYGEKMMSADLSCKEIVKDGLGTASRDNAFKPDGAARLGPIKLSAGAKHILKPSQNIDQDNSRPTHSTLPCAVVTDTSKVPDFQKKLAKIYRF